MGFLLFDLDVVVNSMCDDLCKEFISKVKCKVMDVIEKYFEDICIYIGGGCF